MKVYTNLKTLKEVKKIMNDLGLGALLTGGERQQQRFVEMANQITG